MEQLRVELMVQELYSDDYPGWEFSGWELSQVGVVRVGVIQVGVFWVGIVLSRDLVTLLLKANLTFYY